MLPFDVDAANELRHVRDSIEIDGVRYLVISSSTARFGGPEIDLSLLQGHCVTHTWKRYKIDKVDLVDLMPRARLR